jgi:Domain of unknown function (DUF4837)
MKVKNYYLLLAFLILILAACGCNSKRAASGLEDEIYVVADSVEFEQLRNSLETTFEKTIYTPQPENLFTLKRISVNQIDRFKDRKNIIIVAPLNSSSHTAQYIKAVVDSAAIKKLLANNNFVIKKYDLWARDQLVMVLTSSDMQQLEFNILQHKDDLLYAFQKISDSRLYASLYSSKYEQKKVEGKLLKDYGWIIYVQADFQIALNKPEDNFVWLRRSPNSDMERWIFVHWIDNASPALLQPDSIKAIRNKLTEKYYRTSDDSAYVVIAKDYYTTSEVNFKGKYAILTQGLWELNIKGMGGPFINYTFYDEKSKRLYMLDGSVYAPKYYKRNLIQQMDVTLQSFMTENELSADKKKDLLDAAKN